MPNFCVSDPAPKMDDTSAMMMSDPVGLQSSQIERLRKHVRALTIAVASLFALTLALLVVIIVGWVENTKSDSDSGTAGTAGLSASANSIPKGQASAGSLFAGSGSWVLKSNMPVATSDLAVVATPAAAYLIGGGISQNGTKVPVNSTWIYTSESDSFVAGPPLPTPSTRGDAALSDDNNVIYYVAGRDAEDSVISTDCLYRLDLLGTANEWTTLPCHSSPRSDFCAEFVDGKLYVIGGYSPDYSIMYDTIEVFDTATSTWSTSPLKLPSGRGDHTCAKLNDGVHVVGGVVTFGVVVGDVTQYNTADGPFTKEHVVLNFADGTVTQKAPTLYARGDAALVSVPSQYGPTLVYVGGETYIQTLEVTGTLIATHQVSEYSADTDTWMHKAPTQDARFRLAAASMERSSGVIVVVAFGGHNLCYESPRDVCDEIAAVEAFIDVDHPPIFVSVQE